MKPSEDEIRQHLVFLRGVRRDHADRGDEIMAEEREWLQKVKDCPGISMTEAARLLGHKNRKSAYERLKK